MGSKFLINYLRQKWCDLQSLFVTPRLGCACAQPSCGLTFYMHWYKATKSQTFLKEHCHSIQWTNWRNYGTLIATFYEAETWCSTCQPCHSNRNVFRVSEKLSYWEATTENPIYVYVSISPVTVIKVEKRPKRITSSVCPLRRTTIQKPAASPQLQWTDEWLWQLRATSMHVDTSYLSLSLLLFNCYIFLR